MKAKPIPVLCKTCRHLHQGGRKNGVFDRWCCRWGQAAPVIWKHCVLHNGYSPKE